MKAVLSTVLTCPICGYVFHPRVDGTEIELWCSWCLESFERARKVGT